MWLLPLAVAAWLAVALGSGLRASTSREPVDEELATLVRQDRIAALSARLQRAPSRVWSWRLGLMRNRLRLDLGDVEVDALCYTPPRGPIGRLLGLRYQPSTGWVIEVDGPSGPGKINAWMLDVRPVPG
jgi:hypothetical protein